MNNICYYFFFILGCTSSVDAKTFDKMVRGNNSIEAIDSNNVIILSSIITKQQGNYVDPLNYNADLCLQILNISSGDSKEIVIPTTSYSDIPVSLFVTNKYYVYLNHANPSEHKEGKYWYHIGLIDKKTLTTRIIDSSSEFPSGLYKFNDSIFMLGTTITNDDGTSMYHLKCLTERGNIKWEKYLERSIGAGDFNGGNYSFKPQKRTNESAYFMIREYTREINTNSLIINTPVVFPQLIEANLINSALGIIFVHTMA
ncbi:MAG: hypothetical protein ACK5Z2_06865 [Bacteroidota bacterium]|jgi:hypothetical protein